MMQSCVSMVGTVSEVFSLKEKVTRVSRVETVPKLFSWQGGVTVMSVMQHRVPPRGEAVAEAFSRQEGVTRVSRVETLPKMLSWQEGVTARSMMLSCVFTAGTVSEVFSLKERVTRVFMVKTSHKWFSWQKGMSVTQSRVSRREEAVSKVLFTQEMVFSGQEGVTAKKSLVIEATTKQYNRLVVMTLAKRPSKSSVLEGADMQPTWMLGK